MARIDKHCTIVVKGLKLELGWPCVMGALIFDECTCVYCTKMFYFMTRANGTDTPVAKGLI